MASLSVLDISPVLFGSSDNIVDYLQHKQLLADSLQCANCAVSMSLRASQMAWSSSAAAVRRPSHLEQGVFFSKSKLTLQKWLPLLYWWVREYPVSAAAEEAEVERDTAVYVYQWLREICTTKLLSTPLQLGGPGKVVQIDKSLFRHKPKVNVNKINVVIAIIINNNITGSSRTPTTFSSVGLWNGRHFRDPSSGLYADRTSERCCNSSTNNPAASGNWFNCVVWQVGSIQ